MIHNGYIIKTLNLVISNLEQYYEMKYNKNNNINIQYNQFSINNINHQSLINDINQVINAQNLRNI